MAGGQALRGKNQTVDATGQSDTGDAKSFDLEVRLGFAVCTVVDGVFSAWELRSTQLPHAVSQNRARR
jgi:hypothetical protein